MTKNEVVRRATKQFALSLLGDVLEPLRKAAKRHGYALAVHGSLSRDIDIVAVPWRAKCSSPNTLVDVVVETLCKYVDSACVLGAVGNKPHGRLAYTIVLANCPLFIDLSITPQLTTEGLTT